jgi:hypothetical protein
MAGNLLHLDPIDFEGRRRRIAEKATPVVAEAHRRSSNTFSLEYATFSLEYACYAKSKVEGGRVFEIRSTEDERLN